jgi:hypothetical protein
MFTAASKESLHLALIALALNGNSIAANFLSPNDMNQAPFIALQQLATKVNTYDAFTLKYPGFGGFLPWVYVSDNGIEPTVDFNSSVPSLDNGQLFWSAYAVSYVLSQNFSDIPHQPMEQADGVDAFYTDPRTTLAQRWANVVQRMVDNAVVIFYEPFLNTTTGQFRTVSHILNRTQPIDPARPPEESARNYASGGGCDPYCWLDDPYEGELFTNMAYLLSDWSWTGASPDSVWIWKRGKLSAVNYTVPAASAPTGVDTQITVERGWWFSGHEKWKVWTFPYSQSAWYSRVFVNGEKARTWNSVVQGLPSGFASVTGTAWTDQQDTGYHSDCGIESIAYNTVSNTDILTPYSFAALFLASPQHAYVWYWNYLGTSRGQTCFGSLEGFNRTGANFSPLVTWDTKITTLVAMAGGIGHLVGESLMQIPTDRARHPESPESGESLLDLFVSVMDREMSRVFTGLVGEEMTFQLPQVQIPDAGWQEFPSCLDTMETCQCSSPKSKQASLIAEE